MTVNEASAPAALGQTVAKAATDASFQSTGTTAGKVDDLCYVANDSFEPLVTSFD
ncbi:MAG: hypothetical protein ABJO30_03740 [Hyphomicrobiales bacterium]